MSNARLLAAKADAKRKKEELAETQAINLYRNKLKAAQESIKQLTEELKLKNSQEPKASPSIDNEILQDLVNHADMSNDIPYSSGTLNLAMQIKSLSPKAYAILAKRLPLPTNRQIEAECKKLIGEVPDELIDISRVNEIVDLWKTKHNISKSINLSACLSVDALYFKPDARITIDNCIEGNAFTEELKNKLPSNAFKYFTENPSSLQEFVDLNWEKLVKAAFVFQIQPYDIKYKPFVVHIKPAANGKANEAIVELLHEIRAVVKNRKINVKSFAFDGDNAYKQLHLMYYNSYIRQVLATNSLKTQTTKRIRIVSDFLHLLKRLRYRFLAAILHAGFHIESPALDISSISETLDDMGDVVWCNELFTKMHDSLPLELFKTENLLKLMQAGDFAASAFWFPITFSNIAINEKDIGFEYRDFMLKTAFYFLIYYADCWNRSDGDLRQKKYGENLDVTFYSREILIEFTNTLHSHIQLMNTEKNYNFSRNSSAPLEHKFGFVRGRSHDVHTLSRFIQVISSIQAVDCESTYKDLCNFDAEVEKIRGRVSTTGITVERKDDNDIFLIDSSFVDDLPYTPQSVAKSFLIMAGFDIEESSIYNYSDIFYWTEGFLTEFVDEKPETRRSRRSISLETYKYGTDQCNQGKMRIVGSPVKKPSIHKKDKRAYKESLFVSMCMEKLDHPPTKNDLVFLVNKIKEIDPDCPNPPGKRCSKKKIYDWLVENMNSYYVFLDSIEQE